MVQFQRGQESGARGGGGQEVSGVLEGGPVAGIGVFCWGFGVVGAEGDLWGIRGLEYRPLIPPERSGRGVRGL